MYISIHTNKSSRFAWTTWRGHSIINFHSGPQMNTVPPAKTVISFGKRFFNALQQHLPDLHDFLKPLGTGLRN